MSGFTPEQVTMLDHKSYITDADVIFYRNVTLCQHFPGWTLDYVENLDQDTVMRLWEVLIAQAEQKKPKQSE